MDCANAQYPPITGELRAKLAEYQPTEGKCNLITRAVGSTGYARLIELCDTIDAIHARLEAAYDRLRSERDSMAAALDRAEGEHDFAPESHYVMLPKDADGVPIHAGDVMVGETIGGGYGEPFEVIGYIVSNGVFEPMDEHKLPRKCEYSHHYQQPDTWEQIIEDALDGYHDTDFDKLVARCKALAGDAE